MDESTRRELLHYLSVAASRVLVLAERLRTAGGLGWPAVAEHLAELARDLHQLRGPEPRGPGRLKASGAPHATPGRKRA